MIAPIHFYQEITIDLNRVIQVLEIKENNSWDSDGGKLGITYDTWSQYTSLPYRHAQNPYDSKIIAHFILVDTINRLEARGEKPSVYLLALRWRHGWNGMLHFIERDELSVYADDVANLYYDKELK